MKKYKVLCLTDHRRHSSQNSVYSIMRAVAEHPQCKEVVVASRGIEDNRMFFEEEDFDKLQVVDVNASFDYSQSGESFTIESKWTDPKQYDIILLRLPRPVTDSFLNKLKQQFSDSLFINDPEGIIQTSNKAFLLHFPELCPPIKLCHSIEEIVSFRQKIGDIVLKPLREYGGQGILKVTEDVIHDGDVIHDRLSYLASKESYIISEGYLAMKYLKNVSQGDKRLIVVDGEILAASNRLPQEGSWICNVALGGKSVAAEVSEREIEIIEKLDPILKENGILIYGVDTLVDDDHERILSEVNTLSIGGFPQAEVQTGLPILKITVQKIIDYADRHFIV